MNKKRILVTALLIAGVSGLFAAPMIPLTIGGAFPNYENEYMIIGTGAYIPLQENMELSFTGAFGINTETESNGNVDADFFIPLNAGLNFLFPVSPNLSFLAGVGATAQMEFNEEDNTFHMGPYIKGGVRYRVHRYMQITLEVQQDLIFGPPKWINTNTQFGAGIVFNLD